MFARSLSVLAALALCVFTQSAKAVIMNDGAQTDTTWQQAYQTLGEQYPSVLASTANGTSWTRWDMALSLVLDVSLVPLCHLAAIVPLE